MEEKKKKDTWREKVGSADKRESAAKIPEVLDYNSGAG